jgi:hypothetical protein
MSKMREDKQEIVCTPTTGCVEGDMLGSILIWVERQNRPPSHRFHRKKPVRMSNMSKLRVAVKRSWRYSNELLGQTWTSLRSLYALSGKGYQRVRGCISNMRKNKLNR